MSTKRELISSLREKLRERNADSTYTNQFLYQSMLEQARWLIQREVNKGKIYINDIFFQDLKCTNIIETSLIDPCCPIKTNCKIYRTKNKLPEIWSDSAGAIIKIVTSVDRSTEFKLISSSRWENKKKDPYEKMLKEKYVFFSDDYLWFPEYNPNLVNITAFFVEPLETTPLYCEECEPEEKDCVRYLDTKFLLPDWLQAEMIAKTIELLAGVTKRMPEDQQIDKNATRKN